MYILPVLHLTCLLVQNLPFTSAVAKAERKQWNDMSSTNDLSKSSVDPSEYSAQDMNSYASNDGYTSEKGFEGESLSNSYSESYSGYGGGLTDDGGWRKPEVKTVVKHVYKNIAVPHPVPTPVQVRVPKYIKYFKPFNIARPVSVPHIIPVIKHIQKPIPFFAALPIQQTVPVPKFIGLPVQVRVPRPVFIHVPKIVPVAKKYPVPVEVNIPKPYIVPVYKHVPVPVPHRVPKIINIVKEVPHYVKKPVPVYVDVEGNTYGHNSYSNELHGGHSSEESHSYIGNPTHHNSLYNAMGLSYDGNDYNQYRTYLQDSLEKMPHHYYDRPKMESYHSSQDTNQKLYPTNNYPRAHRLPEKFPETKDTSSSYYGGPNSSNPTGITNVESGGHGQIFNYRNPPNRHHGHGSGHQNYYQNVHGSGNFKSHTYGPHPIQTTTEYSQPVYNPSAYSEYTLSQQQYSQENNNQVSYPQNSSYLFSQPQYNENTPMQTTTPTPVMSTEMSNVLANYQQFTNAFNSDSSDNQQFNGYNSNTNQAQYPSVSNAKPYYAPKSNFEFNNPFKQTSVYQNDNPPGSTWDSSGLYQNEFINTKQSNGQASSYYSQQPSQSNDYKYNVDSQSFNSKPKSASSTSEHNGYLQNYYANSNNQNLNSYDNFIPSGSSHTTSSYSGRYSPHFSNYASGDINNNKDYKNNEKFDHSPSQNRYFPISNPTDSNAPSSASTSYTAEKYGNNYSVPQVSSNQQNQYTPNLNSVPAAGSSYNNNQFNYSPKYPNFAENQNFSPQDSQLITNLKTGVSSAKDNTINNGLTYIGSYKSFISPTSYSTPNSNSAGSDRLNAITNQASDDQQVKPDTFSSFVDTPVTGFSQPADSSSYTSISYSGSNSYSIAPEGSSVSSPSTYNNPDPQLYNNNASQIPPFNYETLSSHYSSQASEPSSVIQKEAFNYDTLPSSYSSKASEPVSMSQTLGFNYDTLPSSYSSQASEPTSVYSEGSFYNNAVSRDSHFKDSVDEQISSLQPAPGAQVYSSPMTANSFQGYNPKVDEMDQHLQSSSSSIINVYTNSPHSKEAQKGETFTFVDPTSLESSQSSKYYQTNNPNSKNSYSKYDVQVVQAPNFNQDLHEPLQTSLDAYVPPQPVYYPTNNNHNAVYKEATTISDSYKQAVNLDSKDKSR